MNRFTPSRMRPGIAAGLVCALALTAGSRSTAADDKKGKEPAARSPAAKYVAASGLLLRREAPDKAWQIVKEGDSLYTGDLLVGLPGAALESRNGAVRLTFISDPTGTSPLPVVETAVILHDSKDADLDVFLERGRIDFVNQKKEKARIRGRLRKESPGGLVAAEPGAQVSLEVFGRWPAGVPFKKNAGPEHAPALNVVFLVLKGEIVLHLDGHHYAMHAPPGPAVIFWDSLAGGDPTPQRLEKLPEWADPKADSELLKKRRAMVEEIRKLLLAKGLDAVLDALVNSDDPDRRRAAVNAMGALDDLKRLATVLANAKHPDTWDYGVRALRHWVGRGPGQDQKLYDALIKEAKFNEREAESVLQLLHSFGEVDLSRPELYEVLIDFLDNERLALRGLAHWHLVRLAPEGRKYSYNPLDSKEVRKKAIEQWKKLIPPGKLPPPPKVEEK